MNFLKSLIMIPFGVIILVFALINNDLVSLDLWPFNNEAEVSLSVLIVFFAFLGFALGKLSSWFGYSDTRKSLSKQKRENKKLNKTQEKLTQKLGGLEENIEVLRESIPEEPKKKGFFEKLTKSGKQ